MLLAGRQREAQVQEERYTVDCMSSSDAFTCAIVCNSIARVRSIFVWCIDSFCGESGLHALESHPRMIEVPLGHAKYTAMTCRKLDSARGGDILVAASSRNLLELWRVRMSGDVALYTSVELSAAPHQLCFSSCASVLCSCEGRAGVVLRATHTLEAVALLKRPGEQATGAAFASRGDITALNKSLGESAGQADDTVVVCYDSGKIAAWGVYDLLSECRSNVASNRARDCEAQPALLLEYSLSCRTGQGPCAVACVSRSLTPLGAKGDLLAGNKKSSFVATDASLFLIVCDRDSKMWLLEANAAVSAAPDYNNGEALPYVCREVRCVDLEREARFHSSPRRADRAGDGVPPKRAPGGRNRATPVKLRPNGSAPAAPAPAAVAQRPSAGALLGLELVSAVPRGASLPVVSGAVVLTQTSVLIINFQTFRLDSAVLMESLGMGALACAAAPSDRPASTGGALLPLSLLPAFDRSKLPYVYMCDTQGARGQGPRPVDRSSPSPEKPPVSCIRDRAVDQEQRDGLGIFNSRPPPSWALTPAEKEGAPIGAPSTGPRSPPQPAGRGIQGPAPDSPKYSFFTSARPAASNGDVSDDLRIGLPAGSPLLSVYRPPPTPEMHQGAARTAAKGRASGGSWEAPKVNKASGKIQDMPVTFHDRIKSSGYGQSKPKPLSFAAKAKQRPSVSAKGTGAEVYSDRTSAAQPGLRSLSAPRHGRASGGKAAPAGRLIRAYPMDCQPCLEHTPQHDYPCADSRVRGGREAERRAVGPLHALRYSEDGAWVGLVSQDSAVETLRTPVGKHGGSGLVYCGHDAGLTGLSFSHDNSFLLSASKDGTARMWRVGRVEAPAVIFSHRMSHPRIGGPGKLGITAGAASSSAAAARNKPFGGEVVSAQFFHLDRFVMLATKSSVYMYSYEPEGTDALNDIKRLQSYGKYKLVTEYTHADTHRVTALACMNSVQSVLCVSATADRKMHLLDASVGAVVRTVDVTHDKAIHCIALPQPSVHCRVEDPHAFNMFATASTDNSILLWDIRAPSSVCRYGSHVNRREAVGCCLSPCMRFLATGSEDRTARVVDLRAGMKELGKVGSGLFRDVVTGVAYHPLHAQLGACSFDGTVKFFKDADIDGNAGNVQPKTGGYI